MQEKIEDRKPICTKITSGKNHAASTSIIDEYEGGSKAHVMQLRQTARRYKPAGNFMS